MNLNRDLRHLNISWAKKERQLCFFFLCWTEKFTASKQFIKLHSIHSIIFSRFHRKWKKVTRQSKIEIQKHPFSILCVFTQHKRPFLAIFLFGILSHFRYLINLVFIVVILSWIEYSFCSFRSEVEARRE